MNAKPTKPASLDQARITNIAGDISRALHTARQATDTHKDAVEAANDANDAKQGERINMMVLCAEASLAGNWTEREIAVACKVLTDRENDKSAAKTIATLCAEIKNAAHPNTRAHVEPIIETINALWDGADLARKTDKTAPHPLKDCFARRYHAFTGLFKQAAAGNVLVDPEAVRDYAAANNPAFNAERVAKRVAAIRAELAEIHHLFPDQDLSMVVDTLDRVDEDTLKAARVAKLGGDEPDEPSAPGKPDDVLPDTSPDTSAETAPDTTTVVVVTGAFDVNDLLDEVLNGSSSGAAEGETTKRNITRMLQAA